MIILDNLDLQDIEILRILHGTSSSGYDANGVKSCGNNLISSENVAKRLHKLNDLGLVVSVDEFKYRLHFNGEKLFWGKTDLESNLLHVVYVASLETGITSEYLRYILGDPEWKFNASLNLLHLKKYLINQNVRTQSNTEIELWKLTSSGKEYIKKEFVPQDNVNNIHSADLRDTIIKTEEKLRDLVYSVLTREYGTKWEIDTNLGWSNKQRTSLEKRREDRKKEFPTKQNPNRLIDYCYILDLKSLITKPDNEKLFRPMFQEWQKHLTFFDELGKHRDPIMHGTDVLTETEKNLCVGICGEFDKVVEHWKKGFSRKIMKYACNINFDVEEQGDDVESQKKTAQQLADDCIEKIRRLSVAEITTEKIDHGEAIVIKLKEGVVKVTTPYLARKFNGTYAQTAIIYIESSRFDAFDTVLKICNHTYWYLEWTVSDKLDVVSLMARIKELTGKTPGSSGLSHNGSKVIAQADYGIQGIDNIRIRARFADTNSPFISQISMTHEDSMFDNGFRNAHRVFSPDVILSISYGEIPLTKIRELIKSSISKTQ